MKKINENNLLILSFLLLIYGFGIYFFINDSSETSVLENRDLSQLPTFSKEDLFNSNYFAAFESYYNDQLPMREKLIEEKNFFEKTVFRKDIIDSIYIHKSGYLIEPIEGSGSIDFIGNRINDLSVQLAAKGVNVFFALAPSKSIVYEEKLPGYYKGQGVDLFDQVISSLDSESHPIDLRESVLPHKEEQNLYFYTDHHWKPKAAYYSYQTIIEEMKKLYPGIPNALLEDQFEWVEDETPFYGSESRRVTQSNTKKSDSITIVTPKFKEKKISICSRGKCDRTFYNKDFLKAKDLYTNRYITYFDGDVPEGVIKNPNVKNEIKILILKDSYANAMIQFIARNFYETRVVDLRHNSELDIKKYIKDNNIDAVLFIHTVDLLTTTDAFTEFD